MVGIPLLKPPSTTQRRGRFKSLFIIGLMIGTLTISFAVWNKIVNAPSTDISVKNAHPDFVGRENYFNDLEKILLKNRQETPSLAVLWGEGGAGKSEMAIAFANRYRDRFSFIFWIETESADKFRQCYLHLAEKLDLSFDLQEPIEGIQLKVHDALQKKKGAKPWLLIYDSVENKILLPQQGKGSILVTTRDSSRWVLYPCLQMLPFTKPEALTLIRKITGKMPGNEWGPLCEELGYHPLAINLAVHFVATTPNMTVEDYLQILKTNRNKIFDRIPEDARYTENLALSWKLSTDSLYQVSPEAFKWLQFCSYLYPDSIPVTWLEEWLSFKGMQDSKLKSYEILRLLINRSFVRYNKETNTLSLHRLKQDILRNADTDQTVLKEVLGFLAYYIKDLDYFDEMEWQQAQWKKVEHWAPHAAWFYEYYGSKILFKEMSDVLNLLGNYHVVLATNFDNAINYYQKSLIIKQDLSKNKPSADIAITLVNLGFAYRTVLRNQEASLVFQEALVILEKLYGDTPNLYTSMALTSYGCFLQKQDQPKRALQHLEKALQIREFFHGTMPHPSISECLKWMGFCYDDLGNYKKALECEQKALSLNQSYHEFKPNDQLAHIYETIGMIWLKLNDPRKALTFIEKASNVSHQIHPKEVGYQPLFSIVELGDVYLALKQYQKSISLYLQAKDIDKKLFYDSNNIILTRSLMGLGRAHELQDKNDEALKYYTESLEIALKVYSNTPSSLLASAHEKVGTILLKMGRQKEAIDSLEKAASLYRILSPDIYLPNKLECLDLLGKAYLRIDSSKSRALFLEVQEERALWASRKKEVVSD